MCVKHTDAVLHDKGHLIALFIRLLHPFPADLLALHGQANPGRGHATRLLAIPSAVLKGHAS